MAHAKNRRIVDLRSLARSHTENCIEILAGVALRGTSEAARVAAAGMLLDRGWGKAPQSHTGEDGEGAIAITIRHIVEEAKLDRRKVVEHAPLELPTKIRTGEK